MTTLPRRNPLILPLDMPDPTRALATVRALRQAVGAFKVGLELFHAAGPGIFPDLRAAGAERLFYVVGRALTGSSDPAAAAHSLLVEALAA